MTRTINLPGGDDEIMLWLIVHGLNPHDIRCRVTIADDGTVVLGRIVRDLDGRPIIDGTGLSVATEPIVIVPSYPLPHIRDTTDGA